MDVGDVFLIDMIPYIRINDKDIRGREKRFDYNAVNMITGTVVKVPNDTIVLLICNPCA